MCAVRPNNRMVRSLVQCWADNSGMRYTGTTRSARVIGWCLIAGSWALAIYWVVFYAALLSFGPDRLYGAFGPGSYNRIVPNGGFLLLATILPLGAIWALPLAALSAVSGIFLRLLGPHG